MQCATLKAARAFPSGSVWFHFLGVLGRVQVGVEMNKVSPRVALGSGAWEGHAGHAVPSAGQRAPSLASRPAPGNA